MISLEEYRQDLLEELRADASISGTDTENEFITRAFEFMDDSGELSEPTELYFGKHGRQNRLMQINGYSFDNADDSVCLIISDFQDTADPGTLVKTQIDVLASRITHFLDEVANGTISQYCDDSDVILPFASMLKQKLSDQQNPILKIKYFIITNKTLSNRITRFKEKSFLGIPVETHVWSIERFWQAKTANISEPIKINFIEDFNSTGIPCIKGDLGDNLEYEAYIAIIPGKLLANIYIEYGSRMLEGNVRAFLGANGAKSVNAGIRRTINTEPSYFFTYNNGIATTASGVSLEQRKEGLFITGAEDLQIINGGQTTASLAAAVLKKENVELDGIYVPMKLTVIKDRETVDDDGIKKYDKMVQNISKYANSQNRVTAADFFSNNPLHVRLEQMSKKLLAPPAHGNPFQTGWYYERARGKYSQEMVGMTKAERDRFQLKFPKKQVITKEKLAKCLNSVYQKPHAVSRGANKNMVIFADWITQEIRKNKNIVNDFFFKKCVCSVILFDGIDTMVKKASWYQTGGYKLNLVPYTISRLFSIIPEGKAFNWQLIWQRQELYPALIQQADIIAQRVNDFICDSHGMIVTEYCKKEETWQKLKLTSCPILKEFLDSLIDAREEWMEQRTAIKEQREINKINDEIMVTKLGANYWKSLLENPHALKELNSRDLDFLKLAASIDQGKLPTSAQAKVILGVRQKLIDKGIISSDSHG